MMFGYLLARGGVDVVVLEKHGDFLRDFRGDTVHPSTLEILHELGLLDSFLERPHQKLREIGAHIGEFQVTIGDFTHLPTVCKFVVLMPQWDFLDFVSDAARKFPNFRVIMEAEGKELIEEGGRIRGVRATSRGGVLEVRADLVVAADGRHSILREKAGLEAEVLSTPIDVLWMRMSRRPGSDPEQSLGHVNTGKFLVLLNRDDYWQCGYVIPKGQFDEIHVRGIEEFRKDIAGLAPFLSDRVGELKEWDQIKLLTVAVDRLREWHRPGFLCIGDSAHAMSPIGGVGINLAIQDAVAAANILVPALLRKRSLDDQLQKVQQRRMFPTRATQRLQVTVQERIVAPALRHAAPIRTLPFPFKMLQWFPFLRRIPARILGVGFRPEHIQLSFEAHWRQATPSIQETRK
jgi:2-polyprenyl-6-methoxyphenol hydroxylase-like FAD-dependent oxidoreductase